MSVGRQDRVTALRLTRMARCYNPTPKRRRVASSAITWVDLWAPLQLISAAAPS
ncbi:hypothetical protein LINPERHAP1_LOCUS28487 [Linum perenne]